MVISTQVQMAKKIVNESVGENESMHMIRLMAQLAARGKVSRLTVSRVKRMGENQLASLRRKALLYWGEIDRT